MRDSFDNVKCEFLSDMGATKSSMSEYIYTKSCLIASSQEGKEVPTTKNNCLACLACKRPKSLNQNIHSLITLSRHEENLKLKEYNSDNLHLPIGNAPSYIFQNDNELDILETGGVGAELKKLIPQQLAHKGCGCNNYAIKMNKWGIDGCKERFDEIVDHLVNQSKDTAIFGWVPSSATKVVAKKLLQTAIDRAEKKYLHERVNWFVALTTAPRQDCTLRKCVESMFLAGFKPTIFAEPGSTIIPGCTTITNKEKKGIWYNWLHSCQYALENSDADVIMTVQDDALFHPDSKVFTEGLLWPDEETGFVSLYTPKHYSLQARSKDEFRPIGVNRIYTRSLWGACALVWPREVLQQVVDHEITKKWLGAPTRSKSLKIKQKRIDNPHLVQNSDTAIGKIMNKMNRKMFFVDPSPVEHIAQHSAVNHGGNYGKRNCIRCAEWGTPLNLQIPIEFDPVKIKK